MAKKMPLFLTSRGATAPKQPQYGARAFCVRSCRACKKAPRCLGLGPSHYNTWLQLKNWKTQFIDKEPENQQVKAKS